MSIFDLIGNNNRSIYLFDTVNVRSAQLIIKDLLRMNQESDEPIAMFINSGGGSVVDMMAIIDVMNAVKSPINTFVLGMAASAASLIAANGNKRMISSNSSMMIHEAARKMIFDTRDPEAFKALDELEELNSRVSEMYSLVTGKSKEGIKDLLSKKQDINLTAKESIEFGLVDEIMTDEQLSKIKLSEKFKKIKLSETLNLAEGEKDLKEVHLLKVCSLEDRGVEITKETLKSLKDNFDAKVRNQDISIEYNTHDNDKGEKPAAAWIKELSLSDDGESLRAKVEYTPKAEQMIKDKEYKYLSVEFDPLYQDEEGKTHLNVLLGGTFTNRPAVKGLDPIKLSENINNNKIDMELSQEEIASIESVKSEMNLEIKDIHSTMLSMKASLETLEAEKAELTANYATAQEEVETAKTALLKIEKETIENEKMMAVNSLVEKGIITNAHKDKVLKTFASKSEIEDFHKDIPAIVSVEAKGSGVEDPIIDNELAELSKQTGVSVEDYKQYGKK